MEADPLGVTGSGGVEAQASSFENELRESLDPNTLLVRWCLEGKPRVSADLSEVNSTVRLGAQLLMSASGAAGGDQLFPPNTVKFDAARPEVSLLHAASLFKEGNKEEAISVMYGVMQDGNLPSAWRRRTQASLAWMLASAGDYRASLAILSTNLDSLLLEDRTALLFAGSRIKTEMGLTSSARRDFELAKHQQAYKNDARINLGEARLLYAEGRVEEAAKVWLEQCNLPPSTALPHNATGEPIASWFAAFAVAAVVGDLGDFVLDGSRQAKHEAANNYAICALHNGGMEVAIASLEQVIKSYNSTDQVLVGNLKTLYELCRTPKTNRAV